MEIIRLATQNSVEEYIAKVAVKRLIMDYGLIKSSTEGVVSDVAVLRHILEYGCGAIM